MRGMQLPEVVRIAGESVLATRNDLTAQIAAEEDNGLFSDTYVAFFDGR